MKLEFNNGLINAVSVDATRLVIKDNFGQPLFLAIEYDPQTIAIYKARAGSNDEFDKLLKEFGIQQTSTVTEIQV